MAGKLGLRPDQRNDRAAHEAIWDAVQLEARQKIGGSSPRRAVGRLASGHGRHGRLHLPRPATPTPCRPTPRRPGAAWPSRRSGSNPGTLPPGMTVGQVRDVLDQKMGGGQPRQDNSALIQQAMRQAGDDRGCRRPS